MFFGSEQKFITLNTESCYKPISETGRCAQVGLLVTINTITGRVGKCRDMFQIIENISNFLIFDFLIYVYQAFAHTLLQLYEFYYYIVCVCALHIR